MARLNEPSAPIESIEALKRRFVRQNREIARVNSTQSIKIRNLECEISRLLSENIALREQVIRLQFEIDNNTGLESIESVKGSLEAKLLELGSLVQELGNVHQCVEGRRALRRRSGVQGPPKKSPDQRNWKNGLTISEVMCGADGRLPPIVEGKYYPRRTLDTEEMLGLVQDCGEIADSPELGPPPVARLEAGDPIKFDTSHDTSQEQAKPGTKEVLDPALLINLETRRKRRESSQRRDNAQADSSQSQASHPAEIEGQSRWEHTLKSGAKRKFSARESSEEVDLALVPQNNDFEYHRSHELPRDDVTGNAATANSQTKEQARGMQSEARGKSKDQSREKHKADVNLVPNGRSVLAPKSVNTDPVSSPVRTSRPAEGEKTRSSKQEVAYKPRDRSKTREQPPSQRFSRPPKASQMEAPERTAAIQEIPTLDRPAPQTPGPLPLDVLSPEDSEPPPARLEGRDTPPPGDLDPEVANTNAFGSMGRASRRQRGSVSYAEPNLRDKMRRPTKELVDAVGTEERLQQKRAWKGEPDRQETECTATGRGPGNMRTVVVKKELDDGVGLEWKTLPMKESWNDRDSERDSAPSPLGAKSTIAKTDLPASVVTERRRRPSISDLAKRTIEGGPQGSNASSAIAALNPKPKSRWDNKETEDAGKASKPAEIANSAKNQESSPTEVGNAAGSAETSKPPAARASRRHSSIADVRAKDALAKRLERRKETGNDGKMGGVPDLKNMRSAATLAVAAEEAAPGRGERAASRRRSMML
ncbi:MAG: hypothetical protein Q9218_000182 [Villophora microphyllina]